MVKALYRKYRSKKLSEIVGQEHITDTLDKALKQGTISHAYLFTGPRGVGKTSIARILAHEVNGLPYDEETTHLDIIEIDAASNRRIDEIRDLKERVAIAPTSAKYKVYIIDEVHMLTKEAFNALLKTLEEPPAHVIFILATTEVHKVPETIISRTQRFTFKPVSAEKVMAHLSSIAKNEHITIDDDALALLAAHGEGSFRDSISLLDQIRHASTHITLADVQTALGLAPPELLAAMVSALTGHDIRAVHKTIMAAQEAGIQPVQLAQQLSASLRNQLLAGQPALAAEETLALLHALLGVASSSDPAVALELALYGSIVDKTPPPAEKVTSVELEPIAEPAREVLVETIEPAPAKATSEPTDDTWATILLAVKAKHNTLYSIARMAQAQLDDNTVTLRFAFPFHQKRLNEDKNKQLLLEVIKAVTGRPMKLELLVDPEQANIISKPEVKVDGTVNLETINNIFGSAEIVE